MGRPDGPRGGAEPRPPIPGGGGIGLPLAPRRGGAGASGESSSVGGEAGAGSSSSVGVATTAGVSDAAGAGARWAGRVPDAGVGVGVGVSAGAMEAAGATGRSTAAGAALGVGAAGSSSIRRGATGRSLPLEVTRRAGGRAGAGSGRGAGASTRAGSATGAGAGGAGSATGARAAAGAAPFFVTLVGFAGSSGWTSRTRPSRSALRRTRSACASSMLEECVLTPIPSDPQRSSVSLFVIPSSLASSCTRFFAAKFLFSPSGCVYGGAMRRDGRTTAVHPRTNPGVGTIRNGWWPGGQLGRN